MEDSVRKNVAGAPEDSPASPAKRVRLETAALPPQAPADTPIRAWERRDSENVPQLHYRVRLDADSLGSARTAGTWTPLVPATWRGNITEICLDLAPKFACDPVDALELAPELWECDAAGAPASEQPLPVDTFAFRSWTAATQPRPPELELLLQRHSNGRPHAFVLFTLPRSAAVPGPTDAKVMGDVRAALDGILWDKITRSSPVLDSSTASACKVDMPADLLDTMEPDMTLVEHPQNFGTMVHANQVLQRLKAKKGPMVGIGPSGCGKTRLLFDLAAMHLSVYFECEGSRIGQDDVEEFRQDMLAVTGIGTKEREQRMRHCFHSMVLARLFLLERFRAHVADDEWDDRIHCKQWLIAQLDGVTKIGVKLYRILRQASSHLVSSELSDILDRLGHRIHFLFDEAHMWHNNKFGSYTTSEDIATQDSQRRTLFTKAVNLTKKLKLASLWVGTALAIGVLADSQSAFALGSGGGPSAHIVAGFRSLSKEEVESVLAHFLNLSVAAVSAMAADLVGRGRLSNQFIAACYRKKLDSESAVLDEFQRYRSLMLSVTVRPSTPPTSTSFVTVWTTLLQGQHSHSIAFSLLAHILWQGPSTYTVPLRLTPDGVLLLPDLVFAGLAFVDAVVDNDLDEAAFVLSVYEPWSWQVGVSILCKLGFADALLQERAEKLAWATVSPGVRGTNVELLVAVALRLATDLRDRVKRLVDRAQRSSPLLALALPDWFEPWRLSLEQPGDLRTSRTLTEACVDRAFRDPAQAVHVLEHAARVDLSYFGIVAAVKTASRPGGVTASMAEDNRRTLAPESYYRTKTGDAYAAAQSRLNALDAAVSAWDMDVGLLCLDIVLPFASETVAPRLEVRTARTGRQDIYIRVDKENLGILIGDGVADAIVATLTGAHVRR